MVSQKVMLPNPIVIFAFNRPTALKRLCNSLIQNHDIEKHDILIFIDGPRNESDIPLINQVKDIASKITSYIYTSETNKGLANSIISGVTEVINKYGTAIVLEDDLILNPYFLDYMDRGLELYKDNPKVLSICGYGLKITKPKDYPHEVYAARRSSSWGWATWADRWNQVDWSVSTFDELSKSKSMQRGFNRAGSDMYSMLRGYMEHKNNSWAIRFCYHQFLNNMYSIHPFKSLVDNEGFGEDGTNCRQKYNRFKIEQYDDSELLSLPDSDAIEIDNRIDNQIYRYHSIPVRIYSLFRRKLNI